MDCEHCSGTGVLHIDTGTDSETGQIWHCYDSPCHACPAGRAWEDATRKVFEPVNPWANLGGIVLDACVRAPILGVLRLIGVR